MVRPWIALGPRLWLVVVGIAAVVMLPVAWYLGSPLFINQTVNEQFPASAPVAATPARPAAAPSQPTAAPVAATPASAAPKPAGAAPAVVAPAVAPTAVPAGPVALSMGTFGEIDALHKGEGLATIYTLPGGQRVLRFENFKTTNGPDLFVYLSGHAAPRTSGQVHEGAAVELGRLKGNIGDQNYQVPANLDLATIKSVVIYCKQFGVVFSTATLAPS